MQKAMLLSFSEIYSTSLPATSAPLTNSLAKASELLFALKLVEMTTIFSTF